MYTPGGRLAKSWIQNPKPKAVSGRELRQGKGKPRTSKGLGFRV